MEQESMVHTEYFSPDDIVKLRDDEKTDRVEVGRICCIVDDGEDDERQTAHVYWLRKHEFEQMEKLENLKVMDRALLHGDIVSSIDPANGNRCGVVVSSSVEVDIVDSAGNLQVGLDSSELIHAPYKFRTGTYVLMPSTGAIGRVQSWIEKVRIRFESEDGNDGICEILGPKVGEFVPCETDSWVQGQSPFRVSRQVRVESNAWVSRVRWIQGEYQGQKFGVVEAVEPGTVYVFWLVNGFGGTLSNLTESLCGWPADDLVSFSHFSHTWWNLGDQTQIRRDGNGIGDTVQLVNLRTRVNVRWQDGSLSENVPARDLILHNPSPHTFFPNDIVRNCPTQYGRAEFGYFGVVQAVDMETCMCLVKWYAEILDGLNEDIPQIIQDRLDDSTGSWTSHVSMYQLELEDDLCFRLGDVVGLVVNPVFLGIQRPRTSEVLFTELLSYYGYGEVIGFYRGLVIVSMYSHSPRSLHEGALNTTKYQVHLPPEVLQLVADVEEEGVDQTTDLATAIDNMINGVTNDDSSDIDGGDQDQCQQDEISDENGGDQSNCSTSEKPEFQLSVSTGADIANNGSSEKRSCLCPRGSSQSAASPCRAMSSSTPSQGGKKGSGVSICRQSPAPQTQTAGAPVVERRSPSPPLPPRNPGSTLQTRGACLEGSTPPPSPRNHDTRESSFSFADELNDHHYLPYPVSSIDRNWLKRIRREWSQLESGLPVGCKVVACETRVDLLRAMIPGPRGTPYDGALFFFDFQIPEAFPASPPQVNFHSYGKRLNPNLYEDGKVCLSLLGTWPGKNSTEIWQPQTSSILQVIISIQGLVLVPDPYYNEPGYETEMGTVQGATRSSKYNESARLTSLECTILAARQPPQGFEHHVREHFLLNGKRVAKLCESLDNGSDSTLASSGTFGITSPSSGFKLALKGLIERFKQQVPNFSSG